MAGLAQVTLHSVIRRFAASNVGKKDVTRLISSSATLHAKQKYQYKTPPNKATAAVKRLESVASSLASKGFLRSKNPYVPPHDVTARITGIFSAAKVPINANLEQRSLDEKFAVLQACSDSFNNHSVPNSQLHEMKTFDDIVEFYQTPVDTITPLDALQRTQLPENLHIQSNYVRFHPAADTMFDGKTAFPKSSTLVTGLRYRNKYQGHIAKRSWP